MKRLYALLILCLIGINISAQDLFSFAGNNNKTGKDLFIFYSANCPHCTAADSDIRADNIVKQKLLATYNIRAINISTPQGKRTAEKFSVTTVPIFVAYRNDGTANTIQGYSGIQNLTNLLLTDLTTKSPPQTMAPPANDECLNAIALPNVSGTISGDNSQATASPYPAPQCQSNWQKDVWYKFTLASPAFITVMVNGVTMADPIAEIFLGNCTNVMLGAACDDDNGTGTNAAIITNLPAGNYLLRVAGYFTSSGVGTFNVVYNFNATCGNGIVENGEQCDDGNLSDGDNCSTSCTFANPGSSKGAAVNEDGSPPNPVAILDLKSPNKGMLVPRLTTAQRTAIPSPPKGLMLFDITTNSFWYYGTGWSEVKENEKVAFHALMKNVIQDLSIDTLPILDSVNYNDGNSFSNGVFTAPEDGLYSFTVTMTYLRGEDNKPLHLIIQKTNNEFIAGGSALTRSSNLIHFLTVYGEAKLTAGTKVRVEVDANAQVPPYPDILSVRFKGHKLY